MGLKIKKVVMIIGLFISTQLSAYVDEDGATRSYQVSTVGAVTGQEDHPFMFTTSSLGRALRATAFLAGYSGAALGDDSRKQIFMNSLDQFSERILNFYVLCNEAQRFVQRELEEHPEKAGYLFEELQQLEKRIMILFEHFKLLVQDVQSHEISTIFVTLKTIIQQTERLFQAYGR